MIASAIVVVVVGKQYLYLLAAAVDSLILLLFWVDKRLKECEYRKKRKVGRI